jgi:signal transduction histidine kinase
MRKGFSDGGHSFPSNDRSKLKGVLLICSFLTFSLSIHAQPNKVDSLLRVLKTHVHDTSRVKTYNGVALEFYKTDLEKSKNYSDSAISLGKKANYYDGVFAGMLRKAFIYSREDKKETSKRIFREMLSIALEHGMKRNIIRSYNNLGVHCTVMYESDSAIYYAGKSLSLDSSNTNKKFTYQTLATAYRYKGDYSTSLSYHMKNLSICQETNDQNFESIVLTNIGNLKAMMMQFDEAIHYFNASAKIIDSIRFQDQYANLNNSLGAAYIEKKEFKKAEGYFMTSLRIAKKINSKRLLAHALLHLGNVYSGLRSFEKSMLYYRQSRVLAREIKEESALCELNIGIGFIYTMQKKLKKAEKETREGLERANRLGQPDYKAQAYSQLYRIDSTRGNFKDALLNYKKSEAITDSLYNFKSAQQISDIEKKYELERKTTEIQGLQLQVEKEQSQVAGAKYRLFAVTSLLLLVISLSVFIFFRIISQRKRNAQEDIIKKQKEVILAQENVQEKISRDLHDNIGQRMIVLKMNLESSYEGIRVSAPVFSLLKEITTDIRDLSHSLSPYILQTEGLRSALDILLKTVFDNSSVEYTFESFNLQNTYPYEIEINLYRIGQELISNVLKHANADQVTMQLYESAAHLILIVEDDGNGMVSPLQKGFGIANIESRVKMLSGMFHFDSANGKTISTIRIPL